MSTWVGGPLWEAMAVRCKSWIVALTMLVVVAATLVSPAPEASASAAPVMSARAAKGDLTSARDDPGALPGDWKSSDDRLWTLRGDASGLRLYSATASSGYSWTTVAELAEPGTETDSWVGNGCITETGKYAAVVYAPRSYTNDASLTLRGARTAVIDLDSGKVTKLPITGAISYYNPGCGTGDSVVFTQLRYLEESGEDSATRLFRVNAAKASTEATIELAGEYSASVPVASDIVATHGGDVVRIGAKSRVSKLAHLAEPAGHLTVDADDGIVLLTGTEKSNQVVRLETRKGNQKPQVIASQSGSWLGLQRGTKGRAFVLAANGADKDLGHGVQRMTANSRSEVSTAGEAWIKPRPWTEKGTPSASATTATRSSTLVELDVMAKETRKSISFRLPTVVRPSKGFDTGAAALPEYRSVLNETEPTCGVPRNDPGAMALQPSPRGVEWAVDQTVMGNLTVARPANWNQSGLPSWSPQGMFPLPALAGGGHIPPQVLLGIVAQESNMWQTSHALTGEFGNTLIGDYYGRRWVEENNGATWGINYDHADCGYGIGQITDGMRVGQMTSNQQKAIAVDYATNIARAAQMLTQKWNELHAAGVIHSNGTTSPIENWFFTAWSYNSGFYAQGESTGDRADPSHWGVGWFNNPANPVYRLDRSLFHKYEIDAKTPGDWSYPERIMGWAAYPIAKPEGAGYRQAWWTTEANRANAQPRMGTFCDQRNHCDPSVDSGAGDTIGCPNVDSSCWWRWPATFNDCNRDVCGHEILRFNETYRNQEPKEGDVNEPAYRYPPTCSAQGNGLPAGALIVDDVPSNFVSPRACEGEWTNSGSFSMAPATPEAEIDLHQIGGGFGGHFWFAHDRDAEHYGGPNGQMALVGTWRLNSPIPEGQAKVYVHIPDHGAHAKEATYEVGTDDGLAKHTISQEAFENNEWAPLGVFGFGAGNPIVRLSNASPNGTADDDVAWDAVAFVPGDYDTTPDVRVPGPDPDAPEPDYEDQEPRVVGSSGTTVSKLSRMATPQTACSEAAPGAIRLCETISREPAEIKNAVANLDGRGLKATSTGGKIVDWCILDEAHAISPMQLSRRELCNLYLNTYTWTRVSTEGPPTVIGSATFLFVEEMRTYSKKDTFDLAVTIVPDSISASLGAVTIDAWNVACAPNCSFGIAAFTGLTTWGPGDRHPVTAVRTNQWIDPSSGVSQKIDITSDYDFDSSLVKENVDITGEGMDYNAMVRCDSIFPQNSRGCVFWQYRPTMKLNFAKYPAAAAFYWVLQQKLPSHPGMFPNHPLHKEGSDSVEAANRAAMCTAGGKGIRLKAPAGQPSEFSPFATSGASMGIQCDEFPFAKTKESGGAVMNPPGQTATRYGNECVNLYAREVSADQWRLFADLRPGVQWSVPTWNEVCGRASMDGNQNHAAGVTYSGFATSNRLLDLGDDSGGPDAFYISVPELAGCDVDSYCLVP